MGQQWTATGLPTVVLFGDGSHAISGPPTACGNPLHSPVSYRKAPSSKPSPCLGSRGASHSRHGPDRDDPERLRDGAEPHSRTFRVVSFSCDDFGSKKWPNAFAFGRTK